MGSIPTRASMDYLKEQCLLTIKSIEDLYKLLKEKKLLNEQFVLDWLDKLNEISVR